MHVDVEANALPLVFIGGAVDVTLATYDNSFISQLILSICVFAHNARFLRKVFRFGNGSLRPILFICNLHSE